jgi:hypothetical protein
LEQYSEFEPHTFPWQKQRPLHATATVELEAGSARHEHAAAKAVLYWID